MVKRRWRIIAFLICLCLNSMPCYVQAASSSDAVEPISIDKECSLTIAYHCEENQFSNLPVKLYRVAEVSSDCQYSLTAPFANSGLALNGIQTVGEWNVVRTTLETQIVADSIAPNFTAHTDENGKANFERLIPGLYLAVTQPITENGYKYIFDSALVALPNLGADGLWKYQVEVTAKPRVIPPSETDEEIEFKVLKLWKGDNDDQRPENVEIEIFRDGISYETVILSQENNWSYSWKAKKDSSDWQVVERNVPSGYTMTVDERETTFVVTNTLNPDEPNVPKPPQTGDTSNNLLYIILMIVAGIILLLLGTARKRKSV